MANKYILGTRGSLLAITQSNQIKQQLEELTEDQFELKIIKTQGDIQTDVPLYELPGKDFFTKELDTALLNGEVDLVVHSYKDLGTQRPKGIALGAITKRSYAEDLLLIKKETVENFSAKKNLIIGTSSPRRIATTQQSLKFFIPYGKNLHIETKTLRGNIHTRIKKLHQNQYDAILLALPGVERLALENPSRDILQELLKDLTFMILPHSYFSTAASQGALAIEYNQKRNDASAIYQKIKLLTDPQTLKEVQQERKHFQNYGGGCHLAVGIHSETIEGNIYTIHKGEYNKQSISKTYYSQAKSPLNPKKIFIGLPQKKDNTVKLPHQIPNAIGDQLIKKIPHKANIPHQKQHLFLASPYGIPSLSPKCIHHLWCSGASTFKKMADANLWVHGCADGLGEKKILSYFQSQTVQLMTKPEKGNKKELLCSVLTHKDSPSILGPNIGCYKRTIKNPQNLDKKYHQTLKDCELFYWTSFTQYQSFIEAFPFIKDKRHGTGPGKTYHAFKKKSYKNRIIPQYRILKKLAT